MTITLSSDSSFDAPTNNELFLHFTLHPNTRSVEGNMLIGSDK